MYPLPVPGWWLLLEPGIQLQRDMDILWLLERLDDQLTQERKNPRAVARGFFHWRKRWDSNPRKLSLHTLSKRADSATLAPFQARRESAGPAWFVTQLARSRFLRTFATCPLFNLIDVCPGAARPTSSM